MNLPAETSASVMGEEVKRRHILPKALVIGLVAGLLASAFRVSLQWSELHRIYWLQRLPRGQSLALSLACGGFGSGLGLWLVRRFAPEAAGSKSAAEENSNRRLAVIVEAGRRKVGLVVDELLGQQQVVVKSLERNLRRIDGLMGATILGDGCVAPIVDVTGIGALDLFSLQVPVKNSQQVAPPAQSVRAA